MSEKEFAVILAEIRELRRAISAAVEHIAYQAGEIKALQLVLEQKQLATRCELDAATSEAESLTYALYEAENPQESSLRVIPTTPGVGRRQLFANGNCRTRTRTH